MKFPNLRIFRAQNKILKVLLIAGFYGFVFLLLGWGFYTRLNLASTSPPGGDFSTHMRAVSDLFAGKNPYEWTLSTYENLKNDPTNKGYAYFPGIMYVNAFLLSFWLILKHSCGMAVEPAFFLHLPGILANLGVGLFLFFYLVKRDKIAALFSVVFWTFNFYLVLKNSLAGFDAVPILFLLLALNFLQKDDVFSGFFFSLSVLFKTFAVITFPLFLFRSKKPWKFLVAGFVTALAFSIPFMGNWPDFWTYVQGALLVRGDRFVQGRPFLYFISYYFSVEFFRIIPFGFYSLGSIFSGWILISLNKVVSLIKSVSRFSILNKYSIVVLPFISFYVLTPVLNRTYLLWGVPFFLLGSYEFFESKGKTWLFYVLNSFYWVFCYFYLAVWKDGFHIWHPI